MKPLAITLGDAAGVGPELVLTAGRRLLEEGPAVVYGSLPVLTQALDALATVYGDADRVRDVVAVSSPDAVVGLRPTTLGVIDCAPVPTFETYPWAQAIPAFGTLQHAALTRAIDDARNGLVDAILTAPWHKARLRDAGLPATGHTEVLQARGGVEAVVMLLAGPVLRVALATAHVPLREVADAITTEGLIATGKIVAEGLRDQYGIEAPNVAFCGLNPHAGEDGVLGDEESRIITPAIEALRAMGIDATGPYPADTLFPRVAAGVQRADGVVAMYHDQGLGPLKTFHFSEAANVTLGLPFIRTSVDHGTAYDIAGKGVVKASSFLYAGRLARDMAARRA